MLRIFIYLLGLISLGQAYRFLVIFPMPSKSHNFLGQGIASVLAEAGHEVVYVTALPREKDKVPPNVKELNVSSIMQQQLSGGFAVPIPLKDLVGSNNNFADASEFFVFISKFSITLLENEVFSKFINDSNEKFDSVIAEWFFSEFWAGLGPLFNCPLIWSATTEAHWMNLRVVDEVMNPAYSIDLMSTNTLPLSFTERVSELWNVAKRLYNLYTKVIPLEREAYTRLYLPIAERRGIKMPSYDEAAYNGSLLLLNSHPSTGIPYKFPQNAKHVGGYHLPKVAAPLPKDLQDIMDNAKNGVIYFSMGSNLQSKDMSTEMKESLLKFFGELNQVVLWKFEEKLDNVPKNVHLLNWAPQHSIIAHRNLKMFITHGGQLSTTEAIHFGVPIVGIPVFGDQFVNMRLAAHKGYGVTVDLRENLAELLKEAVQKVLFNDSYRQKAKQLSATYHDRLVSPRDELKHWVELVVRTQGALHLRSPALLVPFYEKYFLDLALVILIVLCSVILAVKYVFRLIFKNKSSKLKYN